MAFITVSSDRLIKTPWIKNNDQSRNTIPLILLDKTQIFSRILPLIFLEFLQ